MNYIELSDGIYHSDHLPTVRKLVADPYHRIAKLNRWSVSVNKGKDYNFVFCVCRPGKSEVLWTKFDINDSGKCEEIADMICQVLQIDDLKQILWHAYNWIERFHNYKSDFPVFIEKNYRFIDYRLR